MDTGYLNTKHEDKQVSMEELQHLVTPLQWLRLVIKPGYWPAWLKEEEEKEKGSRDPSDEAKE